MDQACAPHRNFRCGAVGDGWWSEEDIPRARPLTQRDEDTSLGLVASRERDR
jgi:hypothetical protein|tara:strand:+ start:91 stop:246 length:156 start_codon:yes stop_codon:yes gene_type:complete